MTTDNQNSPVAPQGVVAWMHPETLDVIHADRKQEWATRYGLGGQSKAEGYSVAMVRADQSAAPAAPALEAPAAPVAGEWQLVPTNPTAAMAKAYDNACFSDYFRSIGYKAMLAAAPQAPAAPVVDDEGCLSDELRDLITGMTVSVDVSTGEHDAGNRLFGEVSEVMDYDQGGDKHGVVLLVQSPEPNFKAAPAAPAVDAGTVKKAARYDWLRGSNVANGTVLAEHFGGSRMQDFDAVIDAKIAARAAQAKEGGA